MLADASDSNDAIHRIRTRAIVYLANQSAVMAISRMPLPTQQARCIAWAQRQAWAVNAVFHEEPEHAEVREVRHQQLRAAIQNQQCEVVIIPALASFGPSIHELLTLIDLLVQHAVDLVSLHESLDTTSAHGSFALLILRALNQIAHAEQPTPAIEKPTAPRKRTQRALPFGYMHSANGIAIDTARAALVRRIFLLHAAGATLPELLQLLNEQAGGWNQRSLAAVLAHEPAYRGGPHPDGGTWPIILAD